MKYSCVHATDLSRDLINTWATIQQSDIRFANPFFSPEFTVAVAAVRDDVFVGLLEDDSGIVGFFPFHRRRGRTGRPIGLGLSDHHGVVATPNAEWNAEGLLRGCGLVRWHFDHLLASQDQFTPYHDSVSNSPIIELSGGMDFFEASLDRSGRKQLREVRRKRDKLSQDIGPVTFTAHSPRRDILETLMKWKSDQCQRTGTVDVFGLDWCVRLIERIHGTRKSDFGGQLACLSAGDTLAAVHFAMYSGKIWHSWFPAYNRALQGYSPGFMLLIEMTSAAAQQGIEHIDLGKGLSLYKKRVMTGGVPVAAGRVTLPSFGNRWLGAREMVELWAKQSFLNPLLRVPGKIIKQYERKGRFG